MVLVYDALPWCLLPIVYLMITTNKNENLIYYRCKYFQYGMVFMLQRNTTAKMTLIERSHELTIEESRSKSLKSGIHSGV